jgi:uncharacterized protein (TIRG00374 family)
MKVALEGSVRQKSWLLFLRLGIAVALLTFLIASTGIERILETFVGAKTGPGLAVGLCLAALFFIGALNVWIVLRTMQPVLFYGFLKVYSYSWAASLITPGQAGDASMILFLKRHGVPFLHTGIAYLIDKVITLFFFFGITGYGCYILLPDLRNAWLFLLALFILMAVLLFALLKCIPAGIRFFNKLRLKTDEFFAELKRLKARWPVLMINILITIAKWLVVSLTFYMAFRCFDVRVQWNEIAVIPILATLVGYVPVSVAGIGTVELTSVYLFSKVGVDQASVLSVYLFMRSFQYLLAGLMLVFFSWGKTKTVEDA